MNLPCTLIQIDRKALFKLTVARGVGGMRRHHSTTTTPTKWQHDVTIVQEPTRQLEKKYHLDANVFRELDETEEQLRQEQQRDEMESKLIGNKTTILRTFCPPLVGKASRALGVIDPYIDQYITDFALDQARSMSISRGLAKLTLEPDPRTRFDHSDGQHEDADYKSIFSETGESFGCRPYLEPKAVDDLKEQLEAFEKSPPTPVHSEEVIGLKETGFNSEELRRVVRLRVNMRGLVNQINSSPRKSVTSSTPQEVFQPPRFRAMEAGNFETLLPEQEPEKGRPYGIPLDDFRGQQMLEYAKVREDFLSAHYFNVEAAMNSQIRYKLPERLSDLESLSVLDYLHEYCEIGQELVLIITNGFLTAKTWERLSPVKMVRDHAKKFLFGLVAPKQLENLIDLLNLPQHISLAAEVYVVAMALCARLYGSKLDDLGVDRFKYCAGPLEFLDFRNLLERLKDIHLEERLSSLLLGLFELNKEAIVYKRNRDTFFRGSRHKQKNFRLKKSLRLF